MKKIMLAASVAAFAAAQLAAVTVGPDWCVAEVEKRNAWLDKLFAGKDVPKQIDGWSEIPLFGNGCTRKLMNVNGRLVRQG